MSNPKLIRRACLHWLARRDYSQTEIIRKLQQKGYDLVEIMPVIDQLIREKVLNDHRFLENYIHSRSKKGIGPERLRMELKARGLTDDAITHHLPSTDSHWQETIRKVWQKQFKGQLPKDYKERAKQMRFLQYRGFTNEQIRFVLKNIEEVGC